MAFASRICRHVALVSSGSQGGLVSLWSDRLPVVVAEVVAVSLNTFFVVRCRWHYKAEIANNAQSSSSV